MASEKSRAARLRRRLRPYGYGLSKGRPRYPSPLNMGLYRVFSTDMEFVLADAEFVLGEHYDVTLEQVEEFLESCEQKYSAKRG